MLSDDFERLYILVSDEGDKKDFDALFRIKMALAETQKPLLNIAIIEVTSVLRDTLACIYNQLGEDLYLQFTDRLDAVIEKINK